VVHVSAAGRKAARRGVPLAVAGIGVGAWATFSTVWSNWTGDRYARYLPPDFVAGIVIPVGGLCLCVASLLAWRRTRRDDFVGERRRRKRYIAGLALGAWLMLLVPIGALVMRWSASVSKDRALLVAAAAGEFRERHGRWPKSTEELAAETKDPLPEPTFRGAFEVFETSSGGFRVGFYAWGFTYARAWEYDVERKTWSEASR
jgi:hypothetical protein